MLFCNSAKVHGTAQAGEFPDPQVVAGLKFLDHLGASCLGGAVAVVLGLVVGIPLAMRINEGRAERRQGREVPASRTLTARRVDPAGWDTPDGEAVGSWRSDGPLAYNLWEQATPWESD